MQLGLGGAQFGLDYGVSNAGGKTAPDEVARILAHAQREGIDLLDTAALYGDSETAIGAALPPEQACRVVTKTPVFEAARIGEPETATLRSAFARSLVRLRRPQVYGLLIHAPGDLLKPGGERLWQAMCGLKQAGQVAKIGFSAYTGAEIDALLARFRPDLVQVPLNALDQRLLHDGHLARLKGIGAEVHARSIFLQGLLLMELDRLPPQLREFDDELGKYAEFLRLNGMGRLEGALQFIRGVGLVDVALIGVNAEAQLRDCISAFRAGGGVTDFSEIACSRESLLNPASWPTKEQLKGTAACGS